MKTWKKFIIIEVITLILNLIWEFSHHSLYIDLSGIPKYQHLIIASIADSLIILSIFSIISLINRKIEWINNPSKFDYLIIIFSGLVVATSIELANLNLGRWKYTPEMPTILGIGISPLIQLSLTGVVSIIIMRYIKNSISYKNK